MSLSTIVTVKSFTPIFKNEEEANNIHVVNFEENDFKVVAQKSLYEIGNKVVYIYPDTNLPQLNESGVYDEPQRAVFNSYFFPDGNPNKSKLGSNGRVKAVKFGFTYDNGRKVFSEGILIPCIIPEDVTDIDEYLGLFKEEKEVRQANVKAPVAGDFPSFISKSDETNYKKVSNQIRYDEELIGSLKIDGSSITVYFINHEKYGICSRNFEKKLNQVTIEYPGYAKIFNKDLMVNGWINKSTKQFHTEEEFAALELVGVEKRYEDEWTKMGALILEEIASRELQIAVRGEIYGGGLNASKPNPHCKLPLNYAVYGIDDLSTGIAQPMPQAEAMALAKSIGLNTVPEYFRKKFANKEELEAECNAIFDKELIEGIVIRSATGGFSAKFMSAEYDEKK